MFEVKHKGKTNKSTLLVVFVGFSTQHVLYFALPYSSSAGKYWLKVIK